MFKKIAKNSSTKGLVADVVCREYTIHLARWIHEKKGKSAAPDAVKAIRLFAKRAMGTEDVRLDPLLNKTIWEHGIRRPARRLRIRLSRRRNEEENAKHKLYTYATYVPTTSFARLQTETVDE